jgi:hypothetical protein
LDDFSDFRLLARWLGLGSREVYPLHVQFVCDGDGSAFGIDGPSGSGTIEDAFND